MKGGSADVDQLQGWHPDPFGRHEARYFSRGRPTALSRDGRVEVQDPVPIEEDQVTSTPAPEPEPTAQVDRGAPEAALDQAGSLVTSSAPTVQPPPPTPAAGWYPDPADTSRQLFWDGSAWTGQVLTSEAGPTLSSAADQQQAESPLPPSVAQQALAPSLRPAPQLAQPQVVYVEQQTTSGMAVASLVLGLIPVVPFVGSILAIVFGSVARKRIRESAGRVKGAGMAGWGLALGIISLIGTVVIVIVLVVSINSSLNNSYNNGVTSGAAGAAQVAQDINAGIQVSPPSPQDYCNQQAASDPNPTRFYAGCINGWSNS